jgi:hypothetical protein
MLQETEPKALKLIRQRELVDEMRGDRNVPIQRTCDVFLLDRSTYHYKSRRPGQAAPANGSKTFARSGEIRYFGEVKVSEESVRHLVERIAAKHGRVHFCYEAGRTAYGLHRLITGLGYPCSRK